MYWKGDGVRPDSAQAAKWYRLGAERGDAKAQIALANLYRVGEGVGEDLAEAANWYRRAAEQGEHRAQIVIAFMYETARGVRRNLVEAHKWYTLALTRADALDREMRGFALEGRVRVEKHMRAAELDRARQLAREWRVRRNGAR